MKLLKLGFRLTGIVVTTAVLLYAVSVVSRSADKNFEKSGAYTSNLLVWEQEYPGEGRLMILGYPVKVDLERLEGLGERFNEFVGKFTFELINAPADAVEASENTDAEKAVTPDQP